MLQRPSVLILLQLNSIMNKLVHLIRSFDVFGIRFSPAINDTQEFQHKNLSSGIVSILVLTFSVWYSIYIFMAWVNWDLIAYQSTEQLDLAQSQKHQYTLALEMSLKYEGSNEDEETINPFDPEDMILMVVPFDDNQKGFEGVSLEDQYNIKLNVTQQGGTLLYLVLCQEDLLSEGQSCAHEETIQEFFDMMWSEVAILVKTTLISPNNFNISHYTKYYYIPIETEMCPVLSMVVQPTMLIMDKGYLTRSEEEHYFVTGTEVQAENRPVGFCEKTLIPGSMGALWIEASNSVQVQRLTYPKIPDVLANIYGVISTLLLIKFLIVELKFKFYRKEYLNYLIQFYYPEINSFVIQKHFWGRVKSITFNNKSIAVESFEKFRAKIRSLINCKLNYFNMIYEISRMQIILQSMHKRRYLRQSHTQGIRLRLSKKQSSNEYIISDDSTNFLSTFQLNELQQMDEEEVDKMHIDDAILLSLQARDFIFSNQNEEQEPLESNKFYVFNKCMKTLRNRHID